MSSHVFVYGSLMFEVVWQSVVQGQYPSTKAVLKAHQRYAVPHETYPAVVKQEGGEVQGRLWLNVHPDDLQRLDAFEGNEYSRVMGEVQLPDGETVPASFYLWLEPEKLNGLPWSVEAFEAEGLKLFMDRHVTSWHASGRRSI